MEQSTIRLSKKLKNELKKQMHHSGETYESVIQRLLLNNHDDDYLSPEVIKNIEEGLADIKAGRVYTTEQVKKRFGLR
jgi:predicted transcriptional regulator